MRTPNPAFPETRDIVTERVSTRRLFEIADIVMGQSPPGSSYNDTGQGLPFFQGKAEFGDVSPTPVKWCTAPTRIAESGDILISVRAPVGPTNIASERCCIGRGLAAVRPKPTTVNRDYLLYFFKHLEPSLSERGQGSTFAAINKKELHEIPVPVPTIEKQRRIVDILSRTESIVRLQRQATEKAREIIPALFVDMFGDLETNPKKWPIARIGDVVQAADYGSSKKASVGDSGVAMIRMGNVTYEGDLDLTDLKRVELASEDRRKYSLVEGDILFNRTNSKDLVGKTGLWDGRFEAVAASYFIRVRVKRDVLVPAYLWAFLNTADMKRRLFLTARGAIGQANINAQELRAFAMPVPPLPLQRTFTERVNDIRSVSLQRAAAERTGLGLFDVLLAETFQD